MVYCVGLLLFVRVTRYGSFYGSMPAMLCLTVRSYYMLRHSLLLYSPPSPIRRFTDLKQQPTLPPLISRSPMLLVSPWKAIGLDQFSADVPICY